MNKKPEDRWVLKAQNDEIIEALADYLEFNFGNESSFQI